MARRRRGRGVFAWALVAVWACARAPREAPAPRRFTDLAAPGSDAPTVARPCATCHRAQYGAWRRSQHARAQRPIAPQPDGARAVIGVAPLQQVLIAAAGGRVQVLDPAFDAARGAWFSIFGAEVRRPGEWGHWTGRGMNWNSQCARCHTTDLVKGYDPATDTYRTSWIAAGVACAQCHGAMPGHAARPAADPSWRPHVVDACGGCHARREELTAAFPVGARFDDHHRLTLVDTPGAYHPDGQVADEDFEWGSLALSRMGHRGVTCLDCHEPHGGGLRAPIDRDQLCLTCHGMPTARGAPAVAATHAHHPAASAGARCVGCHMPAGTFMQRDARRDHGFTSPDPALTRELGVPNACDRCHADRPAGWSEAHADAWYGAAMERPARRRARLVARAQRGDDTVLPALARAAAEEEVDAWRASLVGLLAPWAHTPEAAPVLARAIGDRSALVQAAAVRALTRDGSVGPGVAALRGAPTRLVRVEAAWATLAELAGDDPARAEVRAWIAATCDQPAGALRQSELAAVAGRAGEAVTWARRAAAWDPSAVTWAALAQALARAGDRAGAAAALEHARALSGGSEAAR